MIGDYVRRVTPQHSTLWKATTPLLGRLDVELTERCNLNCMHCYINQPAGDRQRQAREMTTGQVKAVLTEAAGLGALSVRFTGGEPLLRTDFADLYLFARRLGLRVVLFTNGTLLTPELADLLARVPTLGGIQITVYGMTAASYEAVTTVSGAFGAMRRGIDLLLERRVSFLVKGAYLPPTKNEMQAFQAWATNLVPGGAPPTPVTLLTLRGRCDSSEKNEKIKAQRLTGEESLHVPTREAEWYRTEMKQFCSKFMGPPGDRLFRCGAGRAICVDAYGKVQPCMLLRDPRVVYDLYGQEHLGEGSPPLRPSLQDALLNFFPRLSEMRATNADYLARCARCFLHGLCEQCPAWSWMEHGTLDAPVEYLCEIAHAQACELGLVAGGERAWEVASWRERLGRLKT